MYNILKNLIPAGGYKLTELQYKIKKMYLTGDIDEAQMDELLAMALGNISADAERPETVVMIQNLHTAIEALTARVKALEEGESQESESEEGYPAWEPWDGISNEYQFGSIVKHSGALWISEYVGQNVWEPGTPGTEGMWRIYYDHM